MLLGVLLLVVTALGCALFVLKPAWFPVAITASARDYDAEFFYTLLITGLIFIVVQVLLAATIFRGRNQGTGEAPRSGHLRLELVWTVATGLLFVGLSIAGSRNWAIVPEVSSQKDLVEVYAHQFAWSFRYPGPDRKFGRAAREFISDAGGNPVGIDPDDPAGKDDRVFSTLHIPVGREILLLLHSRDVIHDFFVRELRTKQDVVPGMEIPLEIRIDQAGTYEIACAELCGLGHHQMHSLLIAQSPEDYRRWMHAQWNSVSQ